MASIRKMAATDALTEREQSTRQWMTDEKCSTDTDKEGRATLSLDNITYAIADGALASCTDKPLVFVDRYCSELILADLKSPS